MIFALSLLNFWKILRYGSNIFSFLFIAKLSLNYLYHLNYLVLFHGVCYLLVFVISEHLVCHILQMNVSILFHFNVQISQSYVRLLILNQSVQLLSCICLFATPCTAAHQASLYITNCQSLPKPMSIESVMPSNHLIPSSPSPPTFNLSQHQGLVKWVSSSHQVATVLEFQLQHQSFQWTPRTNLL